jgi:hypothetical protein
VLDEDKGCFFGSQGQSRHFSLDTAGVGTQAPTERDTVVVRFRGVIEGKRYDTVFRLYGRENMVKYCRHLRFWGSDKTFISEMALQNKSAPCRRSCSSGVAIQARQACAAPQ